ncbi:MAG: hypothetical protein ACK5LP_06765 [Campylobacteraceae bacterium]
MDIDKQKIFDIEKMKNENLCVLTELNSYFLSHATEFENELYITKKQVLEILEVDDVMVDWYIEDCIEELNENGYSVFRDDSFKDFCTVLGKNLKVSKKDNFIEVFTQKALLTLSMFITQSDVAKALREGMLNNVIKPFIAKKTPQKSKEKKVVNPKDYIEDNVLSYEDLRSKVFQSVFQNKTNDYQRVLTIHHQDSIREFMNLEIKTIFNEYFKDILALIKEKSLNLNRKLSKYELDLLITEATKEQNLSEIVKTLNTKMSERNLTFMNLFYKKIQNYPNYINEKDLEKYTNEKCLIIKEKFLKPENYEILTNLQK